MAALRTDKLKKVICWRILSFCVAGVISYCYLKELRTSLELTVMLTITMTCLHYFFEVLWEKKNERGSIGDHDSS